MLSCLTWGRDVAPRGLEPRSRRRCVLLTENHPTRTVKHTSAFIKVLRTTEDSLEAVILWIETCPARGSTDGCGPGQERTSSPRSLIAVFVGEATVANANRFCGFGRLGNAAARVHQHAGGIARRVRFTAVGCGLFCLSPPAASGDDNENDEQAYTRFHVDLDRLKKWWI